MFHDVRYCFCVRVMVTSQEALDAMTTDEAQLVSAVSMLKALGVEKDSDVEVLWCSSCGPDHETKSTGPYRL